MWVGVLLGLFFFSPIVSTQQESTTNSSVAPTQGETTTRESRPFGLITNDMLLDPDPGDWLMAHRTYDFQAFSPLDEINRGNVHQLKLAWMRALDEGPLQIRPLVYDGVMYIVHPGYGDHLQAWDATTGDLIWDYQRQPPEDLRKYVRISNRTRNLSIYGTSVSI